MTVLGIDTSCDDTSVACVRDGEILSNVIFSQTFHSKYGGVLPELAARSHIKNIVPLVESAIQPVGPHNLDGIGATYGPGLIGSLIVGLSFAKSISYALGIPFYGVNHIEGHIFSLFIPPLLEGAGFIKKEIETPFIAFIVSGGHTELIIVKEKGEYELMGTTLDDAAGETFDKVARMLGLPYPGGEAVEKLARTGDSKAIKFPRARVPDYNFSFSGLKTSVLYYLQKSSGYRVQSVESKRKKSSTLSSLPDIAASFQEAVVDSLINKAIKLSGELKIPRIGVAGGVARNKRLREKFKKIKDISTYFPEPEFCMDNGVMIALCAHYHLMKGECSSFTLKASSQGIINYAHG